jgi:hypothetical protein
MKGNKTTVRHKLQSCVGTITGTYPIIGNNMQETLGNNNRNANIVIN